MNTINIEQIQQQLIILNKLLVNLHQTLKEIETEPTDIYVKSFKKTISPTDIIINNISIKNEVTVYLKKIHDENNGYIKITNLYKNFAEYLKNTYKIDIVNQNTPQNYITAQKLGLYVCSIDIKNLPFTIKKGRKNNGNYWLIQSKQ